MLLYVIIVKIIIIFMKKIKARLLSASAPHASSWLTVVPTVELGVHLDPNEFSIAIGGG